MQKYYMVKALIDHSIVNVIVIAYDVKDAMKQVQYCISVEEVSQAE